METIFDRIKEDKALADSLDLAFALQELAKNQQPVPRDMPREMYITYFKGHRYSLEPCDVGNAWLLTVPGHGFAILPQDER